MNEYNINEIFVKNQCGQTHDEFLLLAELINRCNKISGNFVEVGVYSGGISELIYCMKPKDATLFLCDTFAGLVDVGSLDTGGTVFNGFASFSYEDFCAKNSYVNNNDVRIVRGYFPDSSTEEMDHSKYAFVHLDVDTYSSTIKGLEYFSSRMSIGGSIAVHDYINLYAPGVSYAVDEFMVGKTNSFVCEIHPNTNVTHAIITRI